MGTVEAREGGGSMRNARERRCCHTRSGQVVGSGGSMPGASSCERSASSLMMARERLRGAEHSPTGHALAAATYARNDDSLQQARWEQVSPLAGSVSGWSVIAQRKERGCHSWLTRLIPSSSPPTSSSSRLLRTWLGGRHKLLRGDGRRRGLVSPSSVAVYEARSGRCEILKQSQRILKC